MPRNSDNIATLYFELRQTIRLHFWYRIWLDWKRVVGFTAVVLAFGLCGSFIYFAWSRILAAVLGILVVGLGTGGVYLVFQPLLPGQISSGSVEVARQFLASYDEVVLIQVRELARIHHHGAQTVQLLPNAMWALFLTVLVVALETGVSLSTLPVTWALLGVTAIIIIVFSLTWYSETHNINIIIELAAKSLESEAAAKK